MEDITAELTDDRLISNLAQAEELLPHDMAKKMIESIAQCSVMRLDPYSADRLWDLVTMVFKWQCFHSSDVLPITSRHLKEAELLMPDGSEARARVGRVQATIRGLAEELDVQDKIRLRNVVADWLGRFRVRVSLLLKLGLQNEDASFTTRMPHPLGEDMRRNLGQNIFAMPTLRSDLVRFSQQQQFEEVEVQTTVKDILGEKSEGPVGGQFNLVHLNFDEAARKVPMMEEMVLSTINTSGQTESIESIFTSDDESGVVCATGSLKDDLLRMIAEDCV